MECRWTWPTVRRCKASLYSTSRTLTEDPICGATRRWRNDRVQLRSVCARSTKATNPNGNYPAAVSTLSISVWPCKVFYRILMEMNCVTQEFCLIIFRYRWWIDWSHRPGELLTHGTGENRIEGVGTPIGPVFKHCHPNPKALPYAGGRWAVDAVTLHGQ